MQGIGLDAKPDGNCYTYGETTPLVSAMVNLKYQVTRDGFMADDSVYWQKIAEQEDEAALYESLGNLSLGFMVDADALSYQRDETDPFLSQNELFRKITGLSGDLFTQIPISRVTNQGLAITELGGGHYEYAAQPGKNGVMRWICDVPEEGLYYAYLNSSEMDIAEIATEAHRTNVTILRPYAMTVGTCTPGNTITFTSALSEPGASGTAYLSVYRIDQALFAQGLAILADEQMAVDVWEGPEVSGTIQVEQDGLLYTSLPYESGWTAFVDGEEAPIELMSGAMMCLRLTAGEHTVRFTYMTDGLRTGAIISGVSFAALIVCAILQRRGKRKAAAA